MCACRDGPSVSLLAYNNSIGYFIFIIIIIIGAVKKTWRAYASAIQSSEVSTRSNAVIYLVYDSHNLYTLCALSSNCSSVPFNWNNSIYYTYGVLSSLSMIRVILIYIHYLYPMIVIMVSYSNGHINDCKCNYVII